LPDAHIKFEFAEGLVYQSADTILNHMRHPRIERLNVRQKTIR